MIETSDDRTGKWLYFSGLIAAQSCLLIRYVVLARLLQPTQLGLAAIMVAVGTFFDMVTDVGIDRFLIQDRHGDDPAVQRSAHLMLILRAVGIALLLWVSAGAVAGFYEQPALHVGIVGMAGVPLCLALLHLDIKRQQRHGRFGGEGIMLLTCELVNLIVSIAAAVVLRSYLAVVCGLCARALTMTLVSHVLARRRYGVSYDADHGRRIFAFSLPLMLNGICLFVALQGDRLTVGKMLGLRELGIYSAILLLIVSPTGLMTRFIQGIYMPVLAGCREDMLERNRRARAVLGLGIVLASAMLIGYAALTPIVAPLLFGRAFGLPATVIAMIGALQCIRFLQFYPSLLALAQGRTALILLTNVLRILPIAVAIAAATLGRRLIDVLGLLALGEAAALIAGLIIVNGRIGRPTIEDVREVLRFVGFAGGLIILVMAIAADDILLALIALAAVAALVTDAARAWRAQLGAAWLRIRRPSGTGMV